MMQEFLKRIEGFSPKRLALLAYELQRRVDALEMTQREGIAIVGIGCRFPGGVTDPASYWNLLRNGVDAIREVPSDRWNIDRYYDADPDTPGKMSTRWGGFIDQVDRFDPQFFGISPREAETMDPQQRLLLEVAWEALEHAGMSADRIFGTKGSVFVGMSAGDYYHLMREQGLDTFDAYTASGTAHSIASGRLSYALGLQGASLSIDTACSSSLVAIHQAVQALRRQECDFAIAGGVNLILGPDITIALSKSHMMAPDGRCKAFDASANGFVRGEGCGMVVLKRLSDAQAAGDRIIAIVRGSAINQDGRSNGLTAPNGPSQETVLRDALANAQLAPDRVSYIEAHGTGTSLGDPIEVQALGAVFGAGRTAENPLRVGSVKTNIGHLEASAGVAGLIKVALALHHGELPPQLHFTKPNPFIPWDELPIAVTTALAPWDAGGAAPKVAGVSSFGFSGTNAHILLEEAPAQPRAGNSATERQDRLTHILTLSARHPNALAELVSAYEQRLSLEDAEFADIAYTANAGRAHFTHRLAVLAPSRDVAKTRLSEYRTAGEAGGVWSGTKTSTRRPKIAFLFTGQGAQYTEMGRTLYETQPVFRQAVDRCAEILQPILPTPLLSVLFPAQRGTGVSTVQAAGAKNSTDSANSTSQIDDTAYTQPALFAIEYALAELWASWGVRPSAVTGHSVGEYVAACIAGVMRLEDALPLIATRGRLMSALPAGGAMAAVMADETIVKAAIAPYQRTVSIAAINGPANTVISGAAEDIDRITRGFETQGIKVTRLTVSHAFHSPLLEPMLDEFVSVARAVSYNPPSLDLISNVTGQLASAGSITADYWHDHARNPVRFAQGIETLVQRGYDIFLEIGPQPTLLGMAQSATPGTDAQRWIPSLRKGRNDWDQLLESVAALYVAGVDIDWVGFDRAYERRKVTVPTYPFQRERYWIATRSSAAQLPDAPPQQIAHLLYDVAWRDIDAEDGQGRLLSPAALARNVLPSIINASAQYGFDRYEQFQPALDRLSTAYIVQGLQQLGWAFTADDVVTAEQLADQLGVVDRQRILFRRLLDILGEDGILERAADGWRVVQTPPRTPVRAQCERLMQQYPGFAAELTLTERCAEELATVLRGETDPLQLLFPGGSLDDAEKLYRDSPAARTYNTAIAEVVRTIVSTAATGVESSSTAPAGRPLRILEIGGGTGGTTSYVVPALAGHTVEYTFTDVSPLFTTRAEAKYAAYPFMRYTTLDIGRTPEAQGFEREQYDIILGSNVIHATADLGVTMANVRSLLAPGGLVVLLEGTAPQRFGDLTVGLTDGWWAFTDTDRRSYALMPRDRWLALFAETGFDHAVAIPGDDAGPALSQQAIFVARAGEMVASDQTSVQTSSGSWILVGNDPIVATAVADELSRDHHQTTVLVEPSDSAAIQQALSAANVSGIVYFGATEATIDETTSLDELRTQQRTELGGLLNLVHATISAAGSRAPRLWIVTRGAQPAAEYEGAEPTQATLWGMSHVIAMEHPEFRCTRIDLDPNDRIPQNAGTIVALLMHPGREDQVALRGSRRLARRLVRHQTRFDASRGKSRPTQVQPDATYLITGGLRGLGLRVAEWLADQGARHLVLMGRREPDATAQAVLQNLARKGVTVYPATGDVGNREDVTRVLDHITQHMPALKGVIHAAGVLDDGILAQQRWERFETVLGPKVYGTWHLHTLTHNLDFFVIFSSGASVAGSPGQANHAAANAFEDALAYRRQATGLPTVSINWGPWSEIGAAADRRIKASQFMDAISPDDGLSALKWAMRRDPATGLFVQSQLVVLPADWNRLLSQYAPESVPPLYGDFVAEVRQGVAAAAMKSQQSPTNGTTPIAPLTPAGSATPASTGAPVPVETLHSRIIATTQNRRRTVVQDFVRTQAIKVLGASARERVDMTLPLRELGLDSLMAVELRNILGKSVGRTLPATLTFDHPTVDALVEYLVTEVFAAEFTSLPANASIDADLGGPSATDINNTSNTSSTARLEESLDDLSEDDLALLLAQQLNELSQTDS